MDPHNQASLGAARREANQMLEVNDFADLAQKFEFGIGDEAFAGF